MVLSIQKSQNNCSTHRRGQNKIHYNRDSKTLHFLSPHPQHRMWNFIDKPYTITPIAAIKQCGLNWHKTNSQKLQWTMTLCEGGLMCLWIWGSASPQSWSALSLWQQPPIDSSSQETVWSKADGLLHPCLVSVHNLCVRMHRFKSIFVSTQHNLEHVQGQMLETKLTQ